MVRYAREFRFLFYTSKFPIEFIQVLSKIQLNHAKLVVLTYVYLSKIHVKQPMHLSV